MVVAHPIRLTKRGELNLNWLPRGFQVNSGKWRCEKEEARLCSLGARGKELRTTLNLVLVKQAPMVTWT